MKKIVWSILTVFTFSFNSLRLLHSAEETHVVPNPAADHTITVSPPSSSSGTTIPSTVVTPSENSVVASSVSSEIQPTTQDQSSSFTPSPESVTISPPENNVEQPYIEDAPDVEEPSFTPGPDTVTLTEEQIGFRGNWVKKREWLLRAKELNKKIQNIIAACNQLRGPLMHNYGILQATIDQFFQETGKRLGKIAEAVHTVDLNSIIETPQQKKSVPVLPEFDEEEILKKYLLESEEGLDLIKKLEAALIARIEKFDEQFQIMTLDGQKAQQLYDEMWDIIDDVKAQAHFYELKAISKRVKNLQEYLSGDFLTDFNSTSETTKKQMVLFNEKLLEHEAILKLLQQKKAESAKRKQTIEQPAESTSWYFYYPQKVWYFIKGSLMDAAYSVEFLFKKITGRSKPPVAKRSPASEPTAPVEEHKSVEVPTPSATPAPAS